MNNIQIHKVTPQRAFYWISRAWDLFKLQSGLWMLSFFFIFVLGGLASSIGELGSIAYALINPFLMAGFYHIAFKADNGLPSRFNDLFTAFNDPRVRRVLLQIGIVGFIYLLIVSPLALELQQSVLNGQLVNKETLMMYAVATIIYHMFFLFAVPIAYFYHEQSLFFVIKYAFLACLSNPLAMTLFGLLAMSLMMATVFTLFLALIIVSPLLMISVYLAFNDILRPQYDIEHKADDDNDRDDNQGSGPDFKIEA